MFIDNNSFVFGVLKALMKISSFSKCTFTINETIYDSRIHLLMVALHFMWTLRFGCFFVLFFFFEIFDSKMFLSFIFFIQNYNNAKIIIDA